MVANEAWISYCGAEIVSISAAKHVESSCKCAGDDLFIFRYIENVLMSVLDSFSIFRVLH